MSRTTPRLPIGVHYGVTTKTTGTEIPFFAATWQTRQRGLTKQKIRKFFCGANSKLTPDQALQAAIALRKKMGRRVRPWGGARTKK